MTEKASLFVKKGQKKFYIISTYGELLDLALYLKNVEKHEVILNITDHDYKKIGDGMLEKDNDWFKYLGKGYTWIIDGCEHGKMQDWLRGKGEFVFGGCEEGDELENDRQKNQKWFKELGFDIAPSQNFKSFEDGISFVQENPETSFIMKQNGDAPKRLNHKGKFQGGLDMIYHLEQMKKSWNESEYGPVDFDLMEVVEGMELAVSSFFNGKDWMKDKNGRVIAFLNFEHKKEIDGDLGETTGELGTLFYGRTDKNKLVQDIIMKPGITDYLKKIGFRGVFDINCMLTDGGIIPLEPTCRPGIPSTSYEFLESVENCGEMIEAVAKGLNTPISIKEGWGMVMVLAAKPFPVEADMEQESTSIGEKLWILEGENPIDEFTQEQRKHIHLENFEKKDDDYLVATKNGYLLTVTGTGKSIQETRENLIQYIKDNIYISGMKYRTDIGERYEDKEEMIKETQRSKLFVSKALFSKV
jgi:phosphoribosylamine-glycine ligase